MITTMNRAAARQLSAELETTAQALAERHGLTVTMKGGRFNPADGTYRPGIEFAVPALAEAAANKDAALLGLPADVVGKTFDHSGHQFTVTGINLRAPKYAVQATRDDGKRFKFPITMAKLLVGSES